jgi:hypothetical protein
MTYFRKIFLHHYYRITKFSGSFPQRLRGRNKFFNARSGLPTHRHNYCKMLEFANKKFVKINSPYYLLSINKIRESESMGNGSFYANFFFYIYHCQTKQCQTQSHHGAASGHMYGFRAGFHFCMSIFLESHFLQYFNQVCVCTFYSNFSFYRCSLNVSWVDFLHLIKTIFLCEFFDSFKNFFEPYSNS